MTGYRDDRLAGIGLLLLAGRGTRLATHKVPRSAIRTLIAGGFTVDGPGPADAGLIVLSGRHGIHELLRRTRLAAGAPVLVLARTGRRLRPPAGFRVLARFGALGPVDSPTHLVRLGPGSTRVRTWFATSVRPAWGPAGRVGRAIGRLPVLAGLGFPVHATVLGALPGLRPADPAAVATWPTAPELAAAAVIGLGGGPTAGRAVLTFAGAAGGPEHHLKVDVADRRRVLRQEWSALDGLAEAGGVPRAGRFIETAAWVAAEQSHLDGQQIERRWSAGGAGRWADDVDAVLAWLGRVALPRGIVHGDLWPANVVHGRDGVGVLDWESAGAGDPLQDALGFLVTAARTQHRSASLADATLAVLDRHGWAAPATPDRLAPFLRERPDADPADIETRILRELTAIAERAAPGGSPDHDRRAGWLEARDAVARSWQLRGSPWRPVGAAANAGDAAG